MEVGLRLFTKKEFFKKGQKTCRKKKKILLRFTIVTSKDLEILVVMHMTQKTYPDFKCMFGKALGNGYAITAVIEEKFMKKAEESFISSTFGKERVGFLTGLKTI